MVGYVRTFDEVEIGTVCTTHIAHERRGVDAHGEGGEDPGVEHARCAGSAGAVPQDVHLVVLRKGVVHKYQGHEHCA